MVPRAIIAFLSRIAVGLAFSVSASAQVPVLQLSESTPDINLAARMSLSTVPPNTVINPDPLWAMPVTAPHDEENLVLEPGLTLAGRITLSPGRSKSIFFVQAPSSRIDRIQLWTRIAGGSWRGAEAGDTVPLARWPFIGQFPAFAIPMDEHDVDVIVLMHNDGAMQLPLILKTEKSYQEGKLRQANLTGFVMGMGLMTCVVCLISAVTLRTRAGWLLLLFSAWLVITVICATGYAPIWFLPDWPELTDRSKAFTVVVLAGLAVWTVGELLDRLEGTPVLRRAGPVAAGLAVAYGLVQAFLLPVIWRGNGMIISAGIACALALGMCAISQLRGARHVGWIAGAVASIAGAAFLSWSRLPLRSGLDLAAAASAMLLFAGALLMRHTQFVRARYGRDVMGRAALSANRDPLTATLSYSGLEQAYAEALLSEAAGLGNAAVMLFLLPGLEKTGAEHGFVLTERALVRFAATLQERMGQEWSIGRLSKTRFGAISMRQRTPEHLADLATLVLTRASRQTDMPGAVTDFDLRIVCRARGLQGLTFADMWRQTDEVARSLESGKRIAVM